jgi:hypothetical protein
LSQIFKPQASTPPPPGFVETLTALTGTNPVPPNGADTIFIGTALVSARSMPLTTLGIAGGNTVDIVAQLTTASASSVLNNVGLASFNSAQFTVDSFGYVSLSGTGPGLTITGNSGGPLSPTAGNWNIFGGSVAAGSTPVATSGAGSTLTVNVQRTQTTAISNAANVGLAAFNSAQFSVDPNGFVSLGGTSATTYTANTGTASPTGNNLNVLATVVVAGTTPFTSTGAGSTITYTIQRSQAIAATNATNIGLAAFNSAQFTVDANGFVSTSGTGVGNTITGDSGGALSPTAGNWNILGRSGSKTSGSGSTLTINSPPFSQVGGSGTSVLNSGEFVTAAVTRTLPASAGLNDGDLVIYSCTTAGALVVTANTAQTIRIGTLVSSSAGTATSTAIGDSLTLRFDATAAVWRAVSVIGTWTMA